MSLEELGMVVFVLLAQLVLLLLRNILDIVLLVFVVLMWRRHR